MRDRLFDQPIFVKAGRFLVREVASVMDALEYLDELPQERRDLAHETVVRACWDVLDGNKPVEAIEKAFRRFAKKLGILEEPGVMPWMTMPTSGSGQIQA